LKIYTFEILSVVLYFIMADRLPIHEMVRGYISAQTIGQPEY